MKIKFFKKGRWAETEARAAQFDVESGEVKEVSNDLGMKIISARKGEHVKPEPEMTKEELAAKAEQDQIDVDAKTAAEQKAKDNADAEAKAEKQAQIDDAAKAKTDKDNADQAKSDAEKAEKSEKGKNKKPSTKDKDNAEVI